MLNIEDFCSPKSMKAQTLFNLHAICTCTVIHGTMCLGLRICPVVILKIRCYIINHYKYFGWCNVKTGHSDHIQGFKILRDLRPQSV